MYSFHGHKLLTTSQQTFPHSIKLGIIASSLNFKSEVLTQGHFQALHEPRQLTTSKHATAMKPAPLPKEDQPKIQSRI